MHKSLTAASLHINVTNPHHCMTYLAMSQYKEGMLEVCHQTPMDTMVLVWRRMSTAADQVITAAKAAGTNLAKFTRTKENEASKEQQKERVKRDREAGHKEKEDLTKRAKSLADKKKHIVVPHFYTLSKNLFQDMHDV